MIDAYEIGIQLALQDGVSAGLQVINRELAEVDRAIAATSANLANLEHVAQVAMGGSAAGVKLPGINGAATGTGRHPEPEAGSGGPTRPENDRSDPVLASSAPAAGAVQAIQLAGLAPAAPAAIREQSELGPEPLRERDVKPPAVVPPQSESFAPVDVVTPAPTAAAAPVAADITAPVPVKAAAPVAVVAAGVSSPPGLADDTVPAAPVASAQTIVSRIAAPERLSGDAPVEKERVVMASIAHTVTNRGIEGAKDRGATALGRSNGPTTSGAGTAAAPWSGVETPVASPRTAGTGESPTAPTNRRSERAQGMSGNIMLDGHLVGYWLSEQMAREASRPPSGTSFFDPRQSPAWTASGSL